MMNYQLHSRMMLRVPRFPVIKAAFCTEKLLKDHVFRNALYLASDSLYFELSRNNFDLNSCSEKMKHSLVKYQKRISYRPTPFGSFAGVAVHPFSESNDSGIAIQSGSFQLSLIEKRQAHRTAQAQDYCVNPLIYPYGNDFRLIGKSETEGQNTFTISEIYGSDLISNLLVTKSVMSREELLSMIRSHGIEEEVESFFSELIQLQIIIPYEPVQKSYPSPLTSSNITSPGSVYDSFCGFSGSGSFPEHTSSKIQQAIYCLDKISAGYEPDALMQFKSRFEKLYDRQEIPLLQALDPELGIDYDGLSNSLSSSIPDSQSDKGFRWSPLHEILLRKWTAKTGTPKQILEILDGDLAKFNDSEKQYPPGIAMMFTICGDKLHLKSAGGLSSINMLGRFTVLDPGICELARELALKEMEHNPNVIFAEISHIDSPEYASVTKKAIVYNYQIPFFEPPELPEDFLIKLSDLTISVCGKKIRLWSRRLNKQVIPRFSSAYNYHKSMLPVFRFLCDLQQEGVHANFNFSMQSLFPGMPAYPRVIYKDIILEAASWHLDSADLNHLRNLDPESQFLAFTSLAENIVLPEEFCYEVHDHLLHFRRSIPKDLSLLLKSIPLTGTIILREYFRSQESFVKDEGGQGYTHECVAFLTNKEESYPSDFCNLQDPAPIAESKEKLFPFDDWLYLKLYLHPAGFRDLLTGHVRPFIAQNIRKGNIASWFFISYYDDDFHLRLRVKQIPGREGHLLKSYRKLEQELRQLPNIKKLELSTYFKERERYALIGIQTAEELFRISSEIILAEFSHPDLTLGTDNCQLFSGIRHLMMVCEATGLGLSEIDELSNGFSRQLPKSEKIELDRDYRGIRAELKDFLTRYAEKSFLENDYLDLLLSATLKFTIKQKLKVITDLNHMHLNRLYLKDQQVLERKSYWFLGKELRSLVR